MTTAEEFWSQVQDNITRTGVHLTGVFAVDGGPSWVYTTGRFLRSEPELCITGLSFVVMDHTLNALAPQDGLKPGPIDVFLSGVDACLIDVVDLENERYPHSVTLSLARSVGVSPESLSALQVCWPDDDNRFPWDDWSCEDGMQPLLGVKT